MYPDSSKKQYYILHALTFGAICVLFLLLELRYTSWWDLNDDVLIDHILRGTYTGQPEIRDIQNLFPFSALVGTLQPFWHGDIYASVLLILQLVSVWVIVTRAIDTVWHIQQKKTERFLWTDAAAGKTKILFPALLAGVAAALLVAGELLYHLVFIQYSVTVGMMAAAAIAIIMTKDPRPGAGAQHKETGVLQGILRVPGTYWGAFVLILLGFAIRSEMMLFCSPFIALAALIRGVELFYMERTPQAVWAADTAGSKRAEEQKRREGQEKENKEEDKEQKEKDKEQQKAGQRNAAGAAGMDKPGTGRGGRFLSLVGYLVTIGLICALGMGILKGIDLLGYRSPAWQKFENFFDARTELYDFQWTWMKSYDEDRDFYDSIGLDRTEVDLLWNYNFGLDDAIDETVVQKVADHAAETARQEDPTGQRVREALSSYRSILTADSERPWNIIAPVLYAGVLFLSILTAATQGRKEHKDKRNGLWSLAGTCVALLLVFVCRSGLFCYLLYNRRPVERLTHCLYLLEAVILFFLLLRQLREVSPRKSITGGSLLVTMLILVFFACSVRQLKSVSAEYGRRESLDQNWMEYMAYVGKHPDDFYFTDVYSTVAYSERMRGRAESNPGNWDLAGGWACHSPLWEKKLASYDISSMEEALVRGDNVYFVSSPDRDTGWLKAYYAYRGQKVEVKETNWINDAFAVYQVVAE